MRIPTSTYRLQITADFDLFAAAETLTYLHDLGADWVYLSPILAAEPGSSHGYDVVAHDRIDESRGGADGLAALSAQARRLGMGVLVDIVPNHVGVATPRENAWWWDLLRLGRDSAYAGFFDVDWAAGGDRLRIPVVGDEDVLAGGRIANLTVADGELRYHEHRFPLAPGGRAGSEASSEPGPDADPNSVHDHQHYELVHWRVADHGLNYRRFFAVNTLAALRVEDPEVFAASHKEIRRWFDEGLVDGLRVDHPDGLRDPHGYLDELARLTDGAYVLVEKILLPSEALPQGWATSGTTGYDALALVDRVLTDGAGQASLNALESRLRGAPVDWPATVHEAKRTVADGILGSEVNRIVREVATGAAHPDLVDAVAELLACFPVYRSYLPEGRDRLDEAFRLARSHRPDLATTFEALAPVLGDPAAPPALRFQQTSGMVMAKGVEDSSFYRWSRLTSLNEVGGDPADFAVTPEDFHATLTDRARDWPAAMTTLTTHDTKRGEDVRARITALAELPELWERALGRLLELVPAPDPGFASLLWQAVVGAWPASPHPDLRARLHGYAEKAMREAGDRTTWTDPDESYEAAVHTTVDAAFDRVDVRAVGAEVLDAVTSPGWVNGLSAKLLSLTMPGVPDVYQGSELWEQSLVDPDNRRPVDFDVRRDLLARVRSGRPSGLTGDRADDGATKLLVTHTALTLRRDRPELFTGYHPLTVDGPAARHALAFDRGGAVTVVTRLPVGLAGRGGWDTTTLGLPAGSWRDVLTGRAASGDAPVQELLSVLPVALLVREDEADL